MYVLLQLCFTWRQAACIDTIELVRWVSCSCTWSERRIAKSIERTALRSFRSEQSCPKFQQSSLRWRIDFPRCDCDEGILGITAARQWPERPDISLSNDRWRVICPSERMVGRQGLAHLRTDTHRDGRKINALSFFPLVVPVYIHNVVENVHAWWSVTTAMSVSEAPLGWCCWRFQHHLYDLGVVADAGVCFGVVATKYVNGIMPHYTIFNEEV